MLTDGATVWCCNPTSLARKLVITRKRLPPGNFRSLQNITHSSPPGQPKNPKRNARNINKILLQHPNIKLTWIKAHVGYEGNELADMIAKQAADSGNNYEAK
ncbi:hypothetical protein AVEN_116276-1 [Araneus ventricosus]|uniref:RNase H type-1 domain-containing protein n=1 Tax=Araneus ventricosus TaxID=182803 RepID=A0A4Y2PRJ0_ARAVE|nr:hypothetical protein AVEN_116276-1 [Araneus ventricosus]